MSERVVCAIKRHIVVVGENNNSIMSSLFIEQYCRNNNQIVRQRAWKHEGFGAAFRHDAMMGATGQGANIIESARITGISPVDKDEIIYSCAVGDSSGIFRCRLGDDIDNEGHILHDRDLQFEGVAANVDGRTAFSIRNRNGEWNIAISKTGSPQYREVTEGDSIDKNPAWDPKNPDILYYDSAAIGYENSGRPVIGPRSILKLAISKGEIEEILCGDDVEYLNPQVDSEGNIWCIRRPFKKPKTPVMTLLDVLLLPVRIAWAIFRAINAFTWRNTGETLTSGGPNPAKIRSVPEDLFLEGVRIDSKRSLKENRKAGESLPGIIPRSWELICIDQNEDIARIVRGVCSFALINKDEFVYSNGRHILKSCKGKQYKIGETDPPYKIAIL
jgi:hypothetical protein